MELDRGIINNNDRVAATMYPLGTRFVSGICVCVCVCITCIKEAMIIIIIIITIFLDLQQ